MRLKIERAGLGFLIAWHAVALIAVCFAIGERLGISFGHPGQLFLPDARYALYVIAAIAIAYLTAATWTYLGVQRANIPRPIDVLIAPVVMLGVAFIFLVFARYDGSRVVLAVPAAAILILGPMPFFLPRSIRGWALAALACLLPLAHAGAELADRWVKEKPSKAQESRLITSEYVALEERIYRWGVIPTPPIRGGGISRIGPDFLVTTGDGQLYFLRAGSAGESPAARRLPYRVPINGQDYARSADKPWSRTIADTTASEGGASAEGLHPEWFRVSDILVQELGPKVRVFASHMFWFPKKACWVERVSMLEGARDGIIDGSVKESWKTLFESQPCLPTVGENHRHGIPVVGYFGGGRMAMLGDNELLLTVGDFGFDGVASPWMVSQDLTNSYGKTLRIRISDGSSTVFTFGQRNPQGLYVGSDGRIWSTEHGPQGGDELNLLVEGANYGWPYATFGTDYGSYGWPRAKVEGEHTGYALPEFAWVPSIGASQVIEVQGTHFPHWQGDLLVSSIRAASLFRVRVREGRTIYAEPIELGCGVRDLVEGTDGNLVIWSDDCGIVTLQPQAVSGPAALFAEKCSGCHQSESVSGNRIGPNLHGVLGRPIASLGGYPDYSVCLKKKGGDWSRESLDRFLTSPATFCPGTKMQFAGVESPKDRESIIGYLLSLSN